MTAGADPTYGDATSTISDEHEEQGGLGLSSHRSGWDRVPQTTHTRYLFLKVSRPAATDPLEI